MGEVADYLTSKGCHVRQSGPTQFHTHCMFCGEDTNKRGRLYFQDDPMIEPKGLFKCFVCDERGAYNKLRKYYGDPIITDDSTVRSEVSLRLLEAANTYFMNSTTPEVYKYLMEERGLELDTIENHRFGYDNGGLYKHLVGMGFDKDQIAASGLVRKNNTDFLNGCITIPYITNGQVVAIRGKQVGGKYLTPPGNGARLFNVDSLLGATEVVIAEGEFDCFSGDTEVLTDDGWVRFDQYSGQRVAQWDNGGVISMVTPLAYVKNLDAEIVEIQTSRVNGGFSFHVTPTHRVVSMKPDGTGLRIDEAMNRPLGSQYHCPRVGCLDGPGVDLTDDEIRLLLAVQADGTIDVRPSTGTQYIRFGFTKTRKIERLRACLDSLKIEWSDEEIGSGVRSLCFRMPVYLRAFKEFPVDWLTLMSSHQREFVLSELVVWDGNSVNGRNQDEYATSITANAEWVQTLAHTTGRVATVMERSNSHGEWRKVSILHSKKSSSWQGVTTRPGGRGAVYCVQVPSSMLLIRHQGQIAVSGNCIVVEQMGYPSVGVPGANTWQNNWDNYVSELDHIYICFDKDAAGQTGADKLASRFSGKAKVIQLPEGDYSDVSDWYVGGHGGAEDFDVLLKRSRGGLLCTVDDAFDEWLQVEGNPDLEGIKLGFSLLDEVLKPGITPGQVFVLLAKPGSGKTLFAVNVFHRMVTMQPEKKILFLSLEQTRGEWFERARRIHKFYDPFATEKDTIELYRNKLMIVDKNKITPQEMENILDQFEEVNGQQPDFAVVDYLGYWARAFKGESYERTSAAIMGIKGIAKERRIGFLVPHQTSRTSDLGEEVSLMSAKDSSAVEDTADFLAGIWTPDQRRGTERSERSGKVILKLLKSRRGGVGTQIEFQFAPATLTLVAHGEKEYARAIAEHRMVLAKDTFEQVMERHRSGDMSIRANSRYNLD